MRGRGRCPINFTPDGAVYAIRLGTFNKEHGTSDGTIIFAYKEVKTPECDEEAPNLNVTRDRLLVPSSVTSRGSGYSGEGIYNMSTVYFNVVRAPLKIAIGRHGTLGSRFNEPRSTSCAHAK